MATVRIFVSDVPRAQKFYESALGFETVQAFGPAIAIMAREDLQLWVSGPVSSAGKPWGDGTQPTAGGFTRIVLPLGNLEETRELVERHGGRVANGPLQGPGGTQVIVLDPDGNSIEFFSS